MADHNLMTDSTLRRGLMWLTVAFFLLPPSTGVGIMGFVGIYPFPDSLLMFTSYTGAYVAISLGAALLVTRRVTDRLITLGKSTPDSFASYHHEIQRLKAFPWIVLAILVVYFVGGVLSANLSLEVNGVRTFDGSDYLYSLFGIIPCVMITAVPILFLLTDHIAKYLAPRGVVAVVTPLWFKLVVLGLFTPVMIDTFLITYYFDRTGLFSSEVAGLWFALVVIAALGTALAWRSFSQSLSAIEGGVCRAIAMNDTASMDMHPQSLDEIGILISHLSNLADKEHQIRSTLEQRVKERTRELAIERDQINRYLDIAGTMIVALQPDGLVTLANKKACDILEWEPDQLIGKNWIETVIPATERDQVKDVFGKIMSGQIEMVEYFENNIQTCKGRHRLIAWNNSYLRDPEGNITGCLSSGQDVTDERRVEENLRKSERDFRLLSETLPAGMTYLNKDLCFRLVNSTYATWFGKSAKAFPGVHVREIIGETGMDEMKGYFDRVLSGETVHYERKLPLPTGTIHISTVMVPDVKEDGEIDGFFALAIDDTDKKMTEQQLVQAAKMATLGEMATGIAHELNQPLNVIRMAVSNIQRKTSGDKIDPDYLSDKLVKVEKQVERASAIIDHMRIYGRTSPGAMKPLSVAAMIEGSLHLISEQLRLQSIDVSVNIESPNIMFVGQQVQFEQVMLNLLSNARDALKSKDMADRHIRISAERDEQNNTVNIEVKDDGGGIDPEFLPRIFEPFYTTKEVGEGTGLGLSISYGITNDMGGTLMARNCEGGACFTITLPAHKGD